MKAICASVNFDRFMLLPRPAARIRHAAKLEFSSKDRSRKPEAHHRLKLMVKRRHKPISDSEISTLDHHPAS
jgi:hypothetical protein